MVGVRPDAASPDHEPIGGSVPEVPPPSEADAGLGTLLGDLDIIRPGLSPGFKIEEGQAEGVGRLPNLTGAALELGDPALETEIRPQQVRGGLR